jgi:hypothetical protein
MDERAREEGYQSRPSGNFVPDKALHIQERQLPSFTWVRPLTRLIWASSRCKFVWKTKRSMARSAFLSTKGLRFSRWFTRTSRSRTAPRRRVILRARSTAPPMVFGKQGAKTRKAALSLREATRIWWRGSWSSPFMVPSSCFMTSSRHRMLRRRAARGRGVKGPMFFMARSILDLRGTVGFVLDGISSPTLERLRNLIRTLGIKGIWWGFLSPDKAQPRRK